MSSQVIQNDREVLDLIRRRGPLSVGQLEDWLGVTATAVRHRLNRLTAAGLLDRVDLRRGRGRPAHQYMLTPAGHQATGDNFEDFAKVLWAEVQKIEDASVRRSVIDGVIENLTQMYADRITGESDRERLQSLAKFFSDRQIPFYVETEQQLPVLKIVGCPYPELSKSNHDICEMEQKLFSKLTTIPLTVDHCHCGSGGECCVFQPRVEESSV